MNSAERTNGDGGEDDARSYDTPFTSFTINIRTSTTSPCDKI
jgi:hypothetical protein